MDNSQQDRLTILTLRRGIGIVGMALPFALVIGNALHVHKAVLLGSMSGSYYTDMRDVFVGGMCAIGIFLISYRYEPLDNWLSTAAGVLAIAVAWFPTAPDRATTTLSRSTILIGRVHAASAIALFLLLAAFCLFLFTRSDPATGATGRKRLRNWIYYTCGGIILAAMGLALAGNLLTSAAYQSLRPLFWCEAVAVLAFGAAWLVKGETVFTDGKAPGDPTVPKVPAQRPPAEADTPTTPTLTE